MSEIEVNVEECVGVYYVFKSWTAMAVAQKGDSILVNENETEVEGVNDNAGDIELILTNGRTVGEKDIYHAEGGESQCDVELLLTDKEVPQRMANDLRGERSGELLDLYIDLKFNIPLVGSPTQEPDFYLMFRPVSHRSVLIEVYEASGCYFINYRDEYKNKQPEDGRFDSDESGISFVSTEEVCEYLLGEVKHRVNKKDSELVDVHDSLDLLDSEYSLGPNIMARSI
jgi:hypothetical protein